MMLFGVFSYWFTCSGVLVREVANRKQEMLKMQKLLFCLIISRPVSSCSD